MKRKIKCMGGEVSIFLKLKDTARYDEVFEFIEEKIMDLVKVFNFYDEESTLSQLNYSGKVAYDKDLEYVLRKSSHLYYLSNGSFDVLEGKNIDKRKSNETSLSQRNEKSFDEVISLDSTHITLEEFKIDLGGIAKGYIIDRALQQAYQVYGKIIIDIMLDARGDIVSKFKSQNKIGIENPLDSTEVVGHVNMKSGSLITSGHNKNYFEGGSHILGSESDVVSITLFSENVEAALLDGLATYLIQLNSSEILEKVELEENFREIECLLVLRGGEVLRSSFFPLQ